MHYFVLLAFLAVGSLVFSDGRALSSYRYRLMKSAVGKDGNETSLL